MKTPLEIAQNLSVRYVTLSTEDLLALASIIEPKEAVKGEQLITDGHVARYLYYVERGMLRQYYYKQKREITEHFTTEGNFAFCIASTFRQEPTHLLIEALEHTFYYQLSYEGLMELMRSSLGLCHFYVRLLEWSLIISQDKADSWRFETARERYLRFVREYPEVARRASVNHIASYLLMTPESLSRVRSGSL